ncbi:hypothetical protein HIMB11_00416 [Rhodobacteraceae bacterium HIMB11]|nr:hypothetical protein HIMB11_00416 [Rhodobacteraceae bacterium HIMB11]
METWQIKSQHDLNKKLKDIGLSSVYLPTTININGVDQVYFAAIDSQNIGRIYKFNAFYDSGNFITDYSTEIVLDVGQPGTFDEHGVSPLSVVSLNGLIYLYYAGWQRHKSLRYYLFVGLAISEDGGKTFKRLKSTPVIDRSENFFQVRTGASILFDENKFKCWYAEQSGQYINKNGLITPTYNWSYMESANGVEWPSRGQIIFKTNKEIVGYGRAAIHKSGNKSLQAIISTRYSTGYQLEVITSVDGLRWSKPNKIEFSNSSAFKNSLIETSFAAFIGQDSNRIIFNGSDFGKRGIIYATKNTSY